MSERRAILSARMWLLCLFDAAERIGAAPLDVEGLHRLVYLANAMAPIYDILTPDGYILKYRRGPYFPEVQWDVDRLSAQGLLRVFDVRRASDRYGRWFQASYELTRAGMESFDKAAKLNEVARRSSFLREVVRAFVGMNRSSESSGSSEALLGDVAFSNADEDTGVDFRTASENLTLLAAVQIARRVKHRETASRRDEIHIYFRYLEENFRKRHAIA